MRSLDARRRAQNKYSESHREECRIRARAWYRAHRNKVHQYYLKNKKRISLRNKIYRQVHPEIFRNRSQQHAHLLNRYKISLADYNIMLTEQDGVCAICHKGPESQKGRNLSIDHNHLIKRVRGLLCRKCNSVLAMADDSIEMLDAAKQYLIKTSTKGRS
jgi:hypothetical protein